MLTIFKFSGENDVKSDSRSDGIIVKTTEFILNRKLTDDEKKIYIKKYVVYVRKTAHFTLYFLLGLAFCQVCLIMNDNIKNYYYILLYLYLYMLVVMKYINYL